MESDIREELDWDPLLDDRRIVVKARDGRITLSGFVPTSYGSVLAEKDAFRVGGVIMVDNQLQVGIVGPAVADADIAADCAAVLDKERLVPHGAVDVEVVDGRVTLSGQVRHHLQRGAAEHAVRRVEGVLGVTNDIHLTSGPIPSDVAERIERAFERNAIIDESRIDVTSDEHTIYLNGTVPDRFAMDEAVGTAWLAPGVREVVNRLVIVP